MKKPEIPLNERQRLEELRKLNVLDTPEEAVFDEITALAATVCEARIALISLVDSERQWFKSRFGLEAKQTPRDVSFCGHAILGDQVFEVPDASKDPVFCDNPLFLSEPHVRFYAGAPLITAAGYRIGTLCVIDQKPKTLTSIQRRTLEILAKQVVNLLELKASKKASLEIQTQLEKAQAIAKVGSWEFNLQTGEQTWSTEHYRIFEIEEPQDSDRLYRLYQERIHPEDRANLQAVQKRAAQFGEDFVYDHRVWLDGGKRIKYVQGIGKVTRDESGKPVLISGTCQDRTPEVEQERSFRAILETLGEGVLMMDRDGAVLQHNPAALAILGVTEAQVHEHRHSKPVWKLFRQDGTPATPDELPAVRAMRTGAPVRGAHLGVQTPSGIRWIRASAIPMQTPDGEHVLLNFSDVTQEALLEKEANSFFNLSLNILCIADRAGRFIRINPQFSHLLGYSETELLERPYIEFVHEDDRDATLIEVEKLNAGKSTQGFENRYRCKDGSYKHLRWSISPDVSSGLLYGVAVDVTEQRNAEFTKEIVSEIRSSYISLRDRPSVFWDKTMELLIRTTRTEYGFMGEIRKSPEGEPYLKTFSLTNIAWDDASRALYDQWSKTGLEFRNLNTLFGHVIKTGESLITNAPQQHPSSGGIPHGHPPLNSFMGVPLYYAGKFIGMIGLANKQGGFSKEYLDSLSELFEAMGEIIHAALLERDLKESERALLRAEETTRAKTDFLSTMSHEIRTPLNGVIGMTDLLLGTSLSREQFELVNTISQSGKTLLSIINDILDFSKIEAGKMELEVNECDLNSFLTDVLKPFQYSAQKKGIQFEVITQPYSQRVKVDEGRLGQVLSNLVSNAIKFTQAGSVRVEVAQTAEGPRTRLRMKVSDTGIGIPEDAQARIFESFSQAEQSTARRFGGTGLGLSISKRLINMMNGRIAFKSENGVGTTFEVELDLESGSQISSPSSSMRPGTSPQEVTLEGRVLIAEDNPTNQAVIGRILQKMGLRHHAVANGNEVIDELRQGHFDLILMDCQMPEMDGYEATRTIRNGTALPRDIPIIALTANAVKGEEQRCLDAGMNAYLTKPVNREALFRALRQFLKPRGHAIDQSALKEFEDLETEGQPDIIVELIQSFSNHAPQRVETILIELEKGNLDAASKAAHALKSSARMLGAHALADLCQAVESRSEMEHSDGVRGMLQSLRDTFERSLQELQEIRDRRIKGDLKLSTS